MPPKTDSAKLLAALGKVFSRKRLRWYLFGAQAAIYYGRPRLTEDVDVTVEVSRERVGDLIAALGEAGFKPRVTDPAAFAAKASVIPFFHKPTRMPLDLVIAGDGLEREFLDRARRVVFAGATVRMLTPEDLVITKVLAGRPQDLLDVEGVLDAQKGSLDVARVRRVLGELEAALADVELLRTLDVLLAR